MRPPLDVASAFDSGPVLPPDHAASEAVPAERAAAPTGALDEPAVPSVIPVSAHDAITVPVAAPPPDAPAVPEPPVELDTGWDLGDEDPTAGGEAPDKPEVTTPSSSEMAGDGAVEGDGLDTGWD